jgi:hypothetical protein
VAVRLVWVAQEVTHRVVEMAVSGGLALFTVGTGRLIDSSCRDLGDEGSESDVPHDLAA